MRQLTSADSGFDKYRKRTRRERFLAEMDAVVPWAELVAVVAPYYPTSGKRGRPPVGLERMLRLYCLTHWYNLSDPAAEEALYDIQAMCAFVDIDLGREPVPDETTICKFRHLLERHELGTAIFHRINYYLADHGIQVSGGTMVDATIIDAPSSTKNKAHARDPEMHQTRKGNQWYFGMKGHFGVDSTTKQIHSVAVTAANTHDSQLVGELLHGDETDVWGDSAYTGKPKPFKMPPPMHEITRIKSLTGTDPSRLRIMQTIAGNRLSVPGWNTPLAPSSGSLASVKCATGGSPKMPTDYSSPAGWPTCFNCDTSYRWPRDKYVWNSAIAPISGTTSP